MEYIIEKLTKNNGWCLHMVCMGGKEHAEQLLATVEKTHPKCKFRITKVDKDECWWDDPFLVD